MKQQSFLRKAIFNILSLIRYAMKQSYEYHTSNPSPGISTVSRCVWCSCSPGTAWSSSGRSDSLSSPSPSSQVQVLTSSVSSVANQEDNLLGFRVINQNLYSWNSMFTFVSIYFMCAIFKGDPDPCSGGGVSNIVVQLSYRQCFLRTLTFKIGNCKNKTSILS